MLLEIMWTLIIGSILVGIFMSIKERGWDPFQILGLGIPAIILFVALVVGLLLGNVVTEFSTITEETKPIYSLQHNNNQFILGNGFSEDGFDTEPAYSYQTDAVNGRTIESIPSYKTPIIYTDGHPYIKIIKTYYDCTWGFNTNPTKYRYELYLPHGTIKSEYNINHLK